MEVFFRSCGAKYLVDGVAAVPKEKEDLDGVLASYMWSKIGEDYQYLVVDHLASALLAWKSILSHFTQSTMPRRIQARHNFYHVVHDPSQPIGVYIHAVGQARKALTTLGCKVDDVETLDVLLMNLDPSFASVKTAILTSKDEPNLEGVKAILLGGVQSAFPVAVKSEPSAAALAAQGLRRGGGRRYSGSGGGHSGSGSGGGQFGSGGAGAGDRPRAPSRDDRGYRWCDPTNEGHCHRCGRSGHIAARCVHDMPQHVKDWVLAGPPQYASVADASNDHVAGLTTALNTSVLFPHRSHSRSPPSSPQRQSPLFI